MKDLPALDINVNSLIKNYFNFFKFCIIKHKKRRRVISKNFYGCGFNFFKINTGFSFFGNFWKEGEKDQIAGIWNRDNKWCWLNTSLQFLRILYLNQSSSILFNKKFQNLLKLIQCKTWFDNRPVIELVFKEKLLCNFIQNRGYNAGTFIKDITSNSKNLLFQAKAENICPKCSKVVKIDNNLYTFITPPFTPT